MLPNTAAALLPAVSRSTLIELAALMTLGSMVQPDDVQRMNYRFVLMAEFGVIEKVSGKYTRAPVAAHHSSDVMSRRGWRGYQQSQWVSEAKGWRE